MEKQIAIELRNITKTFGKTIANKNVNLKVYKNEVLAILGENGSGKTTLMNIISGIYAPDEGEIFINGEPAAENDLCRRRRGCNSFSQGRVPL